MFSQDNVLLLASCHRCGNCWTPEMHYWCKMLSRKSWKPTALADLCQCTHREVQWSNQLQPCLCTV